MINELSCEKDILLSMCDLSGKLSVTGTLDIFMDTATLHEEASGFGVYAMMEKGLYWIIGKNRICYLRRPKMMEKVIVRTWFSKPSKLFVNREYLISDTNGEVLVKVETEWLVATEGCEKLMHVRDYIPDDFVFPEKELFDGRMKKIDKNFPQGCFEELYTVKPTDVDFVGHMNNAAYSRMFMSLVPSYVLEGRDIRGVEIFYALQCREDDEIHLYKRDADEGLEFGAFLPDGSNVMTARLILGDEQYGSENRK